MLMLVRVGWLSDSAQEPPQRVHTYGLQVANKDSFYYTNMAPQHEKFNQGAELWLGLEDFVLNNTVASGQRVSVFNGPIFTNQDNLYRGVPIPKVRCCTN
jgi:endonuclease G